MFNVSKKTLSVVLCLALLLSVVAVCFMTPATAKTVTNTESFDVFKELSKEVTPSVNLTFGGTAKYGIPLGRYTKDVAYANNYAKVKVSTGWIFFGKNGSVGQTTVAHNDTDTEKVSTALSNVYKLTKDNTYSVTFKYKFLKGATVTPRTFDVGIATDPTAGPAKKDNTVWTNNSTSGFGVVWEVNGETQTGKLTQDTDWQTVTVSFKAVVDGYFGIHCGGNVTGNQYFALDDVKIYHCDALDIDSTFQNKINFDLGGFAVDRENSVNVQYATEENGNGYGVLKASTGGSVFFSNAEYGYGATAALTGQHKTEEGLAKIADAYSKMYKFLPGQTYEVTFKYRYATEGHKTGYEPVVGKTNLELRLMADPGGQAHDADALQAKGNSWAKNVKTEGVLLKTDPTTGEWQDCKVTFTVKTSEDVIADGYANVRTDVGVGYPFDGAYFGIRSAGRVIHVDDYQVKVLTKEDVSVTADYVYHDMENEDVATNKTGSVDDKLVMNNSSEVKATFAADTDDATRGKVLTMQTDRGTFGDTGILVPGKKYYISFDAKGTADNQAIILIIAGLNDNENNNLKGSLGGARYFISNSSGAVPSNKTYPNHWETGKKAFKFYIDGKEVEHDGNTFRLSTKWQHFGIVIDLTDSDVVTAINQIGSTSTNTLLREDKARYFYFGNTDCSFDNFMMVQTPGIDGAVPETEKADFSYVSETYESTSASKIKASTTTNGATVSEGVVSVPSGRFTFTDSGIITAGHKYTISFEAQLSSGTEAYMTMIISYLRSTGEDPRYFITDGSSSLGSTNAAVRSAFKFYIENENGEKVETALKDYKVTNTWQKFIVEFDYTDAAFLAATEVEFAGSNPENMGQLTKAVNYFHVGANNAQFKNLKIVEETFEPTIGISYRQAQLDDENNYRSAGLRFRAGVPTAVATKAAEIGFVVAPSTHASMTENWYKLEGGLNAIARKGVVKVKDSFDYIYNPDDNAKDTEYQMVITGLSAEVDGKLEGKTAFSRRFSAVLYIMDAEGNYSYYALGEASYYEALGNTSVYEAQ